ncbi:CTD nuclear envelope phosphatase 1A-like isoform X2 [Apostichopus japonicus]|uniref:CTD nuclear envelope phosphatase 1A-like isoform X2 n=1 Tax=Stichopus japonicus TaxID=307972 RepID=UPI003AB33B35
MPTFFLMGFRMVILVASKLWEFFCCLIRKNCRKIIQYQTVKYDISPLCPISRHKLQLVKRKTMILDLDETLVHSQHVGKMRPNRPSTPPDFVLKVSQWYDLVVFTASMEIYGSPVVERLDNGRGILNRRYYRQHCKPDSGYYAKDLSAVNSDLSSIFIVDNSPSAYRLYPDNGIPILSWMSDASDINLLSLLPFLDALRFTSDVRSVLRRNSYTVSWKKKSIGHITPLKT